MTRDRPRGTRERRREGVQAGPPESRTWQTRLSGGPSIERRESKACSRAGMSVEQQPRRAAAEYLSKARTTACGSARAARFERTSPRAARGSETPRRAQVFLTSKSASTGSSDRGPVVVLPPSPGLEPAAPAGPEL